MLSRPPDMRNSGRPGQLQVSRNPAAAPPGPLYQANNLVYQQPQANNYQYMGQQNYDGYIDPSQKNSNNQYQDESNYENNEEGNSQQDQEAGNEQVVLFWQHKFLTIYEKFQVVYEKVQWMRTNFSNLNDELKAVDSETEWNQAKEHHDDYLEQLEEFSQQLVGIYNENLALYQQNSMHNDQSNIWKQRYYELFESYKALQLELNEAKNRLQGDTGTENKDSMNEILENYRQLQRQYTKVAHELTEYKNMQSDSPEAETSREKLQYALNEADRFKVFVEQLHSENQQLLTQIDQLQSDNQLLNRRIANTTPKHYQLHQKFQNQLQQQLMEQQQRMNTQFEAVLRNKQNQLRTLTEELEINHEKYQKLTDAFSEKQRDATQGIKLLEREIEQKNKQLQRSYKNIEQIEKEAAEDSQLLKQKQALLRTKVNEVREIKNQLRNVKIELEQKTSQVSDCENQIKKLRRDLQYCTKNQKQYKYSNHVIPQIPSATLDSFKEKQQSLKRQYEIRMNNMQQQCEQKISRLKKVIKQKEQGKEISALLSIKLQAIEKKNKNLTYELEKLNKQLMDKDMQLLESRRHSHDHDKFKELELEYNLVLKEKEHITHQLQLKNIDFNNLEAQVREFEVRIQDLGSRSSSTHKHTFAVEIEDLNNRLEAKEQEIKKMVSNAAVKQEYIGEMETEIKMLKALMATREKQVEREKGELNDRIKQLIKVNQELQKKMKEMEYDYGPSMKNNLEQEIRSLRNQIQLKQETIMRMESDELELRSKISHYERIRGAIDSDIGEMASKIRENETQRMDMIKKVENAYREVKKKEKEIKELIENEKNLKNLVAKHEARLADNEKTIVEKEKILEGLESQLVLCNSRLVHATEESERMRARKRDETDLLYKESDDLKKKLFQYELGYHEEGQKSQETEQRVQQLMEEKEFLKSELAAALEKLGQLPVFKKGSSSKKSKAEKASEGIDYIQKRLFEFNSKLDTMIKQNREIDQGKNLQRISDSLTEPRKIQKLKSQLEQLRRYCAKLQVEAGGESIRPIPKHSLAMIEKQKAQTDNYNFYKQQVEIYQQRIQKLIQVNSDLKQHIESLLKTGNGLTSKGFFKQQLDHAEQTIQQLKNKVKKLNEQNRILKGNVNGNGSKLCRDYQDKMFELQNKIFDLQRKINSLELQRSKSENQKLTLNRNITKIQSEIDNYQKQHRRHERQKNQLEKQVQHLESEMSEILSKMRILESENFRLNQALQSSFAQAQIMVSTPGKSSNRG